MVGRSALALSRAAADNNNSYSRFYTLYGHCVGLGANVMEWTALIRLHSDPSDTAGRWNSVRLMLAAMNILYYSLFGGDMDASEWSRIMERHLLSYEEVQLLRTYRGFKPFLAACWALEEAQVRGAPPCPPPGPPFLAACWALEEAQVRGRGGGAGGRGRGPRARANALRAQPGQRPPSSLRHILRLSHLPPSSYC